MIRRLYVHNFRCLENFELVLKNLSSVLLIGRNGAGKTTVGMTLEVLQRIARGTNRVGDLVRPRDLVHQRADVPMRFEVEVALAAKAYVYSLALDYPNSFRELRVVEEKLSVDGQPVFRRELAQVRIARSGGEREAAFRIDWHLVALPIVQQRVADDPITIFKQWLATMLILRPVPSRARGDSNSETLQPDAEVTNFGAWFTGVLRSKPAVYRRIDTYLREMMPDLDEIQNPQVGRESQSVFVHFSTPQSRVILPFEELSDGEKCLMMHALAIAANEAYGPLLCFWDEPDNFLAPFEVGPSIIALRRAFAEKGQLIVTSHNPEAIRHFSDENTLVLLRHSHLEPTVLRSVEDIRGKSEFTGDFINALLRGDVGA